MLIEDCRHLSCKLDEDWFRRARSSIQYDKTFTKLSNGKHRWKYDESDCECISAYGYDKHDPWNECRVCGKCIADEPMLGTKYDSYEDQPYCISCVMALEKCSIEDIAPLFN